MGQRSLLPYYSQKKQGQYVNHVIINSTCDPLTAIENMGKMVTLGKHEIRKMFDTGAQGYSNPVIPNFRPISVLTQNQNDDQNLDISMAPVLIYT